MSLQTGNFILNSTGIITFGTSGQAFTYDGSNFISSGNISSYSSSLITNNTAYDVGLYPYSSSAVGFVDVNVMNFAYFNFTSHLYQLSNTSLTIHSNYNFPPYFLNNSSVSSDFFFIPREVESASGFVNITFSASWENPGQGYESINNTSSYTITESGMNKLQVLQSTLNFSLKTIYSGIHFYFQIENAFTGGSIDYVGSRITVIRDRFGRTSIT